MGILAMILLGDILGIVAGVPLLIVAMGVVFFIMALLVHKKILWKPYLAFPLLILAAFCRMEEISKDTHINSDDNYHIEGKVNKVVDKGDYAQIYLGKTNIGIDVIVNYSKADEFVFGDVIGFDARLREYDVARNPGNFDTRLFHASTNIVAKAGTDNIELVRENKCVWINGLFDLKRRLLEVYENISVGTDAGIYNSIFLGDKGMLDGDIKKLYQINGIAHILAISGVCTLSLVSLRPP